MIILIVVLALVVVALLATGAVVRTRRRGVVEEPQGGAVAPSRTRPPTRPAGRPSAPTRPEAPPRPAPPVATPEVRPEATTAPPTPELAGTPPTFRERMGKARGLFSGVLGSVRLRGAMDTASWNDLEEALLRADVGVATTDVVLADLRRKVAAREVAGGDQLIGALRADLVDLLEVEHRWDAASNEAPDQLVDGPPAGGEGHAEPVSRTLRFDETPGVVNVWLFVGVNGVGKTTTLGKLARQQVSAGRSVLLAAGDTFRAAAGEQLARWAERSGAEIVRGAEGGDPSAVVYDAVERAAARGNDLVLADTAGRLHTKVNLVEELKKIRRTADRQPGRVTEVLLVLDATTGQNGLIQAKQFTEAVAVTGVVLTKLDGTAKGGVVISVQRELGLPVKLVGLGEGPDDLVEFEPEEFVDALLS